MIRLEALQPFFDEHFIDATRYLFSSPLSHFARSEQSKDEILSDGTIATNYQKAFFIFKGVNLKQLNNITNKIVNKKFRTFLIKIFFILQ